MLLCGTAVAVFGELCCYCCEQQQSGCIFSQPFHDCHCLLLEDPDPYIVHSWLLVCAAKIRESLEDLVPQNSLSTYPSLQQGYIRCCEEAPGLLLSDSQAQSTPKPAGYASGDPRHRVISLHHTKYRLPGLHGNDHRRRPAPLVSALFSPSLCEPSKIAP